MKTYRRICVKDYVIEDVEGTVFAIKRGQEYLTSAPGEAPAIVCPEEAKSSHVVVFSKFWVAVPIEYFGGEIQYTEE